MRLKDSIGLVELADIIGQAREQLQGPGMAAGERSAHQRALDFLVHRIRPEITTTPMRVKFENLSKGNLPLDLT